MDRARPSSKAKPLVRAVWIASLAVALTAGGVALAGMDFGTKRVARGTMAIETVQRGTMEIKVSANGQLLPKNIEVIASQVTGRIAKKYVKPGDLVTPGQVLVELANPELLASEDEARSAWEGAVTELRAARGEQEINVLEREVAATQAELDLRRAELDLQADAALNERRAIAEIDYKRRKIEVEQRTKTSAIEQVRLKTIRDNVEVQLDVRRARIRQLARALDRAKNQAAGLKITAGIGGIVQAIDVEVGQQLQPGSPVGRIAEQASLYAELRVLARDATEIEPGLQVVVDTKSHTVNGAVSRVDPAVTEGTVIVDVELEGELPPGARPQLAIEGVVYLCRLPDVLFVGRPAYVKTNGTMSVYKLEPSSGYARRVPIKAGKLSINYLQILEGLAAGDRIITSEIDEFQDQERILID